MHTKILQRRYYIFQDTIKVSCGVGKYCSVDSRAQTKIGEPHNQIVSYIPIFASMQTGEPHDQKEATSRAEAWRREGRKCGKVRNKSELRNPDLFVRLTAGPHPLLQPQLG